ncbi:acyltransferase [Dissulfurirhabdus thermomarina]|uniref:Acyltransferase n=1 Tax=Dissulfurirhabdus thermomarina TaxID=1765737 RepID=A0A6N9TVM2_DISTH|nr:acyltransferase [Dissulfurirhabdus thermomarina]NDY42536.1 acyltransferase [Dissulfurirhabdus thermomarina]NMX23542.1 acyltransferase [Dissulfurirhabdus thermomarina]
MKLETIQAWRALAVLLVVLFHGTLRVAGHYGVAPLWGAFRVGFCGVHLFFVISGFIILFAHAGDVGRPRRLPWYWTRRLVRIYPFYWIILLASGGWRFLVHGPDLREFWLNALFFMKENVLVIPVSWTLRYEVLFYALFSALVLDRRLGAAVAAAWLGLLLAGPWRGGILLHPFNLLFLFGLAAGGLWFGLRRLRPAAGGRVGAACLAAGGILFAATAAALFARPASVATWPRDLPSILGLGAGSLLLVLGSASPAVEGFFARRRLLSLVGDASYAIYLVHGQVERLAFKLVTALDPLWGGAIGSQPGAALVLFFLAASAVGAGLLLHRHVERPLLRRLRRSADALFARGAAWAAAGRPFFRAGWPEWQVEQRAFRHGERGSGDGGGAGP